MVLSPNHSDYDDSDSDNDGNNSDVTLEDLESFPRWDFGHPLERMVRVQLDSDDEDASSFYRSSFSSCSSESGSSISTNSSVIYDMCAYSHFQHLSILTSTPATLKVWLMTY